MEVLLPPTFDSRLIIPDKSLLPVNTNWLPIQVMLADKICNGACSTRKCYYLVKDDFIIQTTADAVSVLTTITSGVTLLLVALVCVSLVVGGVGIMNIMYVSVAERTFEIGLRKSVGARSRDILAQFLIEAILITLGGGIVGIFLGLILALIIYLIANSFNISWIYSIPLNSILLSVTFSASIGLIFGYYPASRAANLNPIEALRRE
jgi:putative ABC transport system permease protein